MCATWQLRMRVPELSAAYRCTATSSRYTGFTDVELLTSTMSQRGLIADTSQALTVGVPVYEAAFLSRAWLQPRQLP